MFFKLAMNSLSNSYLLYRNWSEAQSVWSTFLIIFLINRRNFKMPAHYYQTGTFSIIGN